MRFLKFTWYLLPLITACTQQPSTTIQPLDFDEVSVGGELNARLMRNFDRLEEEKYQPEHVFLTNEQSGWWPGDTEGRTVLGLVMDARATGRTPKYLDQILALFPAKMNERGYFGDVYPDSLVDEQQLSSNGWVLRGLCEYYLWKKDTAVLSMINRMVDHLVLQTAGFHSVYPIDPSKRDHAGAHSGTRVDRAMGKWILSTDIGCDFIFMDGVIQAYAITGRAEMKPIIEEMIEVFKKIDVEAIKAQTHATLTGVRGLIRYFELTGDSALLQLAEQRYQTYRRVGMTENYENYNWFGRPQWTEPCAIVDSYLAAMQLWQHTTKQGYIDDAQKIYYNALSFAQRFNGGFGTQKCSGAHDHQLTVDVQEAHWCCTMRGGEGLARVAQYTAFSQGADLIITNFRDAKINRQLEDGSMQLTMMSNYPFENSLKLKVSNMPNKKARIKLAIPSWMIPENLTVNNKPIMFEVQNGLLCICQSLTPNSEVVFNYRLTSGSIATENPNSLQGLHKFFYGPLLLARPDTVEVLAKADAAVTKLSDFTYLVGTDTLHTVYHLMDSTVVTTPVPFSCKLLFQK